MSYGATGEVTATSGARGEAPCASSLGDYDQDMGSAGRSEMRGVRNLVLLARITGCLNTIMPPAVSADGGSNLLIRIAVLLGAHPGLTPGALADRVGSDKAVISRALNRLDDLRFITRRTDRTDRRYVRVRLSARGRREIEAYSQSIVAAFQAAEPDIVEMLSNLSGATPQAVASELVEPGIVMDQLAELGISLSHACRDIELAVGISSPWQRFVVAAATDTPQVDVSELASAFTLPRAKIDTAAAELERLGLVTIDHSAETPVVAATEAGRDVALAEAACVAEQADEVVRVFSLCLQVLASRVATFQHRRNGPS